MTRASDHLPGNEDSLTKPLPRVLLWYTVATVLLMIAAAVSTLMLQKFGPKTYPYNNPIFHDVSYQFDFLCFQGRFRYFHQPRFFTYEAPPPYPPFTYPAPMALVYEGFYLLRPDPHSVFIAFCLVAYSLAATLFTRALIKRGIPRAAAFGFSSIALLTSYPVLLQLYLANLEVVVWAIVSLGVWAWYRDRSWSAAACFGVAASLKLFPFVYLGLLLAQKKYKETIFAAALLVVMTLTSLAILGPTVSAANHGIEDGLKYFRQVYVLQFHDPESGMDHSLYAWIKIICLSFDQMNRLRQLATPFVAIEALAGIALYIRFIRRLPPVNQLLALSIAAVILPPVSHDYTLLHLYGPWVLLILWLVESRAPQKNPEIKFALLGFAILFATENYLIVQDYRFAGQVKSLVLVGLFVFALCYPMLPSSCVARNEIANIQTIGKKEEAHRF